MVRCAQDPESSIVPCLSHYGFFPAPSGTSSDPFVSNKVFFLLLIDVVLCLFPWSVLVCSEIQVGQNKVQNACSIYHFAIVTACFPLLCIYFRELGVCMNSYKRANSANSSELNWGPL